MGGLPEPPRGWDSSTDSLEDLVRIMFQDQPAEPDAPRPPTSEPSPPASADVPPARREQARRSRVAAPALAGAALLIAGLAGGQILAATTAAAPTLSAAPLPAPDPQSAAARVSPLPSAVAQPVVLAFGKRSELGDGWRLGTSRPYLCDVLMAIPVLQKDGTRIMRVTLTLTNRSSTPQATRTWTLAATADGAPAELVLWPAERFRGVPDVTLGTGRSVGFLVAIRVPEHPVQVRITAQQSDAPRAVLAGVL
jgi:hypothetical protein